MPPRRECGRRAGVVTPEVRELQRQVRALQEDICRGMNLNARNESEDEAEEGNDDQEEVEVFNPEEERIFRSISKIGKRPKIEVPTFSGNLNPEELIDWINKCEEYFEYEDIEDPDRVKFAKARLKGHAKIWWQEIQLERNRRGKDKITRWDQMVDKLKRQFIPVDYELDLLKKMQGLKQVGKSVQEYTEEFYRILIRTGHAEADKEKVACYLNGLRLSIQEELNLVRMNSIEEAYQFALKVEEKLNKKFET